MRFKYDRLWRGRTKYACPAGPNLDPDRIFRDRPRGALVLNSVYSRRYPLHHFKRPTPTPRTMHFSWHSFRLLDCSTKPDLLPERHPRVPFYYRPLLLFPLRSRHAFGQNCRHIQGLLQFLGILVVQFWLSWDGTIYNVQG